MLFRISRSPILAIAEVCMLSDELGTRFGGVAMVVAEMLIARGIVVV